jgi:hypothetical protein
MMKFRNAALLLVCGVIVPLAYAENLFRLSTSVSSNGTLVVVLNHTVHVQYGCSYPVTYQLKIPRGSAGLSGKRRYTGTDAWELLPAKTSQDFFNAIEAVRFDYDNGKAYASVAFSASTDSVFIQIVDSLSNPVAVHFDGICRLYDNRVAAVTATADDYSDWVSSGSASSGFDMNAVLSVCRSYNLYVTVGVITDPRYTTNGSWSLLQQEADSGFIEVASHSRNHLPTPYDSTSFRGFTSAVGEVIGSSQDIKANLTLPPLFSMGGIKYVYTWIAPYGDYDAVVDSLTGAAGYLAVRLYANLPGSGPREYVYGDSALANWDSRRDHFTPFYPSVELGAPSWGGGDTSEASLNGLFDAIVANGDLYHFMWHPQVVCADINKPYFRQHLSYISNRKNIWYANLGHIYLYHLIQTANTSIDVTAAGRWENAPSSVQLLQNYPNPFNPVTTIRFGLVGTVHVTLTIYDIVGRTVAVVVNERMGAGNHEVKFDGTGLASGAYIYRIHAGGFVQSRMLLLLK